jgi:hypothetical protein
MNLKLKEFVEESMFFGNRYASQDEFAERLSELIVRECAGIAQRQNKQAGDDILKKFGFE